MKTRDLVVDTLTKVGCQPEIDDKDNICFKYQGESMYVSADNNFNFITIWDPWWIALDLTDPDVALVKEAINMVNVDIPLVNVVYSVDEENGKFGVHTRCDSVFMDQLPELDGLVKSLLEHFFLAHDRLKNAFGFLKQRQEGKKNEALN